MDVFQGWLKGIRWIFLETHTANHLRVRHMPKEQASDEHHCTEDTLLGLHRQYSCGTVPVVLAAVGSLMSRQL